MSNSGRKGNPAKTSADVKQQCHKQPPVQSEPLVPSTSGERIPRSSSEIQSTRLFASTLINTNDQRSKQNRGQSPLSVLSTSSQCSSAEKQSNTDKSYASTLKSNLNEHITQTPGQSQPSIQSTTQYSNPTSTSRGTTEDQSISFITNIPNFEYVNCLTGSTAAMNHYPQGILPRKNKLPGEYHHGPILNESSGNSDDPLDVTGKSSKTNTELQSMMDHGGSHVPGIDTEESKTDKPFRSSKEIEIGLQGAMHSSDIQEQMGTREKKLITNFEDPDLTNQSGYGATSKMSQVNLNLAKSTEEGKQKYINMRQNEEISEFSIKYAKITGKQPQISTPSSQSQSTSVAKQTQSSSAQDVCSQHNNHERKNEANCVNAKDSTADKIEMDKSSVHDNLLSDPTTQKPNVCNSYFSKTPTGTSNTPKYTAATSRNSGVSLDNLPQDVGSPLDSGKDVAKHLNDHCKVDNDFDYTHEIEIPDYFYKKAEKEKDPKTYLKGVSTSVQGVIRQLCKGSEQAVELLNKSQNYQWPSENLQQLINDYKNLHEKVLPDIENAIKKWDHPPYNEKLDKFKTFLVSIEACLQTRNKKIKNDLPLMSAEANQLFIKAFGIIEPLSELCDMKAQIEKLGQQLMGIKKLKNVEKITTTLRLASEKVQKNIDLLKDMEKKYAATENFLNMDLKNVKEHEIESSLSQLKIAINALSGLNLLRYKKDSVKKYEDALKTLKETEKSLKRKKLEYLAQKEFEEITSVAEDLKNQATNNKESGLENATLMKSIESTVRKFRVFLTSLIHCIPETNQEFARKTIREHEVALNKVRGILKADEDLKAMDDKLKSLVKSSTNFGGTSCELHKLITQLESHLLQYKQFSACGKEAIQTKVNSSISSLQTCVESLTKQKKPEIEANEKFEKSCLETSTLLKEVNDFWGPSDQIDNLFCKLNDAVNRYLDFESMGYKNHENKISRMQNEIFAALETLRSRQPQIKAQEIFEKSYSQINTTLKEVDDFWGPSSEIKDLIQKLNDALGYYLVFQHMGRESLAGKLINVQGEIIIARDNLLRRQPIIEALECLANIRVQAEGLQKKVFAFVGDMSLLRNYMREVEKLQSDLSSFNTMDNDKVKKEAESVSHTIRNTLLNLESIELKLENEMAESMAVEECAEKQSPDLAQQLEESSNMKWICNIAMQLMSIYRQLSNNGINVMELNQLRWLEMRNGELERMLVNDVKPKSAHEIKAVSQAKKLCLQIQEMINNNDKHCEEIPPEFNVIRATAMKALEYHTKIFNGDINSNNQIRWLETQLIECQTKLDQLELPEGVARESRKDVLNLCNQAMSALKKHSYCKN